MQLWESVVKNGKMLTNMLMARPGVDVIFKTLLLINFNCQKVAASPSKAPPVFLPAFLLHGTWRKILSEFRHLFFFTFCIPLDRFVCIVGTLPVLVGTAWDMMVVSGVIGLLCI